MKKDKNFKITFKDPLENQQLDIYKIMLDWRNMLNKQMGQGIITGHMSEDLKDTVNIDLDFVIANPCSSLTFKCDTWQEIDLVSEAVEKSYNKEVGTTKDLLEDFTIPRWVKWTKRKPTYNGSVFMRFRDNKKTIGSVLNGELMKLSTYPTTDFYEWEDTFYWLEENIDAESYSREEIY